MAGAQAVIDIIARDQASRVLNDVGGTAEKTGKSFDKFKTAAVAGAVLAGAALIKFGKSSVTAFKEAEVQSAQLDLALRKFPKAATATRESYDELNASIQRKTGTDGDALAAGQAVLAQFDLTGAQIQEITPLLADYAVKTGKDLPSSAKDLGRALQGNARALKGLGLDIPSATNASKALSAAQGKLVTAQNNLVAARKGDDPKRVADAERMLATRMGEVKVATANNVIAADTYGNVLGGLESKIGGTADAMGKTAAGQAQILSQQFGDLQEQVGAKLLPALVAISGQALKLVDFLSRNSNVIIPLVAVVGGLAATIWAVNAASKAWAAAQAAAAAVTTLWTGAQRLLNISMIASPIGLIVLAVVGLVAVIAIIATKTQFFQTLWSGAWGLIKGAVSGVFNWIKGNWPLILAIITGPIGLAVLAITKNWDKIKAGVTAVKDWITGKFDGVVTFLTGLPSRIASAAAGMWDGIKDAFRSVINFVIGAWNSLRFSTPKISIPFAPDIPAISFGVPQIPLLAGGGIVNSPTLAMIGEGGPEAVVPLGRGAGLGGDTYNITINGAVDTIGTARQLQAILNNGKRSGLNYAFLTA